MRLNDSTRTDPAKTCGSSPPPDSEGVLTRMLVRQAVEDVGLSQAHFDALRPEAQERADRRVTNASLPKALIAYQDAKALLTEHMEDDEATAALDALILSGDVVTKGLLGQRRLLGDLVRDGAPAPRFLASPTLGEGLFYADQTWIVSGHKKSGKSWAMASTCVDQITAGVPVVYLDLENGEEVFSERLGLLRARPEVVDDFFHYIPFPTGLTLEALRDELEAVADALPGAFVVFDSLRGLLRKLSPPGRPLNPNDATDVELVCGPIMEAVKTRQITCGIIDHAKKSGSDGDEYSTAGAGAKEAAVDAVYFWTKVRNFSQDVAGEVRIAATSDRRGRLDFERHYRVGGQGEDKAFLFDRIPRSEAGSNGRVLVDVRQLLGDSRGEHFTKTRVRKEVTGDNNAIDAAIDWLVAREDERVYADTRPGWSHPKYVHDPERAVDDVLDI